MQSDRKKGYKPWNTGRTGVYTKEQLERMTLARKNATTDKTIEKIKEARSRQDMSWRHNWHPSDEVRDRMSKSHIGKRLTDTQKQKISKANEYHFLPSFLNKTILNGIATTAPAIAPIPNKML